MDGVYSLPLTLAMLKRIRSEAHADDVPIDAVAMATLTAVQALNRFASGPPPAAAPCSEPPALTPMPAADPELIRLLNDANSPEQVRSAVGARDLNGWLALLEGGRPALLVELKRLGIASLSARQGFANALSKHARAIQAAAPSTSSEPPAALVPLAMTPAPLAVSVGGGLCNRLRVGLSFLAIARSQSRPLLLVWPVDTDCPGRFTDCFVLPPNVHIVDTRPDHIDVSPPPAFAAFHPDVRGTRMEVECYRELQPSDTLIRAVARNVAALGAVEDGEEADHPPFSYSCVHIRRTDHWNAVKDTDAEYIEFINQQPIDTAVYIACDNSVTQKKILSDQGVSKRVRKKALTTIGHHRGGDGSGGGGPYGGGPAGRHTSLFDAAVDLLTCAAADGPFMGSHTSSFSDTIGRLRRLYGRVHAEDDHRFADIEGKPNLRSFAVGAVCVAHPSSA